MIETLKKNKTLLSIITFIIVAFIGYSILFGGDSNDNVLTSQNVSDKKSADSELLLLLVNLRSITLDESLFNDPAFGKLIDFGQELVQEPVGRQNPFAPVGFDDI